MTKQDLTLKLTEFSNNHEKDIPPSGKQCLQFLIEELQSEQLRIFLLESVVRSFREAFVGTNYEAEVRGYAVDIWSYVETLEKK